MTRARLDIMSLSPEQTGRIGAALGSLLRAGDTLAMVGDLGAGKTQVVRGVAEGMGLDPQQVSSPTFVIVSEYTSPGAGVCVTAATPLVHVDAYRLGGPDDLDSVGWERATDGSAVLAIEWADRIEGALGDEAFVGRMRITPAGESVRRIELDAPAAWALRPGWRTLVTAAGEGAGHCPTCGAAVAPGAATWPFCREQCRMADLGRWFDGRYVVSRELRHEDTGEG